MLTLIACDLLHLVPVTQVQPWRWLWLGTAVSALLLPQILRSLWGSDRPARATGLLLLGAWVFAANPYALVAATAATASLTWTPRLRDGESRWIFYGAIGLFVIAAGWRLASNLEFTESHFLDPNLPSWFRLAMSFAYDGSAPAALLASVWWMAHTTWARPGLLLFAGLAGAGCAALAPVTLRNWTRCEFTAQQMAQFAPLREAIPIGSEVFWPESPLAVWMLLGRPLPVGDPNLGAGVLAAGGPRVEASSGRARGGRRCGYVHELEERGHRDEPVQATAGNCLCKRRVRFSGDAREARPGSAGCGGGGNRPCIEENSAVQVREGNARHGLTGRPRVL